MLPTKPRDHVILSGPLRGAHIQTSWHDYPAAILGITERPLTAWFEEHVEAGETWLDVGGHYGYTAIALSRLVGPGGRVFAFEPVVSTAGCLARTRELNRLSQLTVVPLALIADSEMQAIDVPATRGMADSTLTNTGQIERILGIALWSIWPAIGGEKSLIHGIKVDVQGLEFQVLLGMREQLVQWSPKLVIEFHRGVDRREILDLLISCGYSARFEPIGAASHGILADDTSYVFLPEARTCAYSSIRSITVRR